MARPEGVVAVGVAERRELRRESAIALLLALVEAEVLEQHHIAVLHGGHGAGRGRIDAVLAREGDAARCRIAEKFGQSRGDRPQRERRLEAAPGRPAEVAREDRPAAAFEDRADRRQGRANAAIVGDSPVVERHVEVDADEDPLARDIEIGDRTLGHGFGSAARRSGGVAERSASDLR
jgi:hypothetical protein